MRTKALLGLAVIAASALTAAAQNNVYSLNVVGYYNVTVPAGKFALIANQMVGTNYTVANVLSTVPGGTTVLKWNGASYTPAQYDADFGWDRPEMTLGPGEAAFVKNSGTADFTITFVGEVNQATNTMTIPAGFSMASLFTPQAGKITTDFGYTPPGSESILQWNGASFSPKSYDADFGWDSEPELKVGEGFFFNVPAGKAHTWTRSFTVQ